MRDVWVSDTCKRTRLAFNCSRDWVCVHRPLDAAQVCGCARVCVCAVNGMRLHMHWGALSSWASSVRGNVNIGPWPSSTGPGAASQRRSLRRVLVAPGHSAGKRWSRREAKRCTLAGIGKIRSSRLHPWSFKHRVCSFSGPSPVRNVSARHFFKCCLISSESLLNRHFSHLFLSFSTAF